MIADQRALLVEQTGRRIEEIPQVWVLFTEVLKYYDGGLKLPPDVTLMFSDDNVGYLRRLPTAAERASRTGGFGIYHHMDMNGAVLPSGPTPTRCPRCGSSSTRRCCAGRPHLDQQCR